MFLTALAALGVDARRALMVGDRASHDGGAAEVGIATLILPPATAVVSSRGLDAVTRLVGIGDPVERLLADEEQAAAGVAAAGAR